MRQGRVVVVVVIGLYFRVQRDTVVLENNRKEIAQR